MLPYAAQLYILSVYLYIGLCGATNVTCSECTKNNKEQGLPIGRATPTPLISPPALSLFLAASPSLSTSLFPSDFLAFVVVA